MFQYYVLLEYTKSTFLTDCKHLPTTLDILQYFKFKNFYKCFYASSVKHMGSHNV